MAKFKDPNPDWPVPVRKLIDGRIETQYAHNPKELDRYTLPEHEGGKGYVTGFMKVDYPKVLSHPLPNMPNVNVRNEAEEEKERKRGYTTDHWENQQAKAALPDVAAQPSFDPKAQVRIDLLDKQVEKQSKQIEQLLEALAKKK